MPKYLIQFQKKHGIASEKWKRDKRCLRNLLSNHETKLFWTLTSLIKLLAFFRIGLRNEITKWNATISTTFVCVPSVCAYVRMWLRKISNHWDIRICCGCSKSEYCVLLYQECKNARCEMCMKIFQVEAILLWDFCYWHGKNNVNDKCARVSERLSSVWNKEIQPKKMRSKIVNLHQNGIWYGQCAHCSLIMRRMRWRDIIVAL